MKNLIPLFVAFVLFGLNSALASQNQAHLIAIGQGISSPSSTSTVNYSSGFTAENPVGTIYQSGVRVSLQYDTDEDDDGMGGELGYGTGQWGIAGGYYKRDCDDCDGDAAGALGVSVGDFSLGLTFEEDVYGMGFLFNPNGQHRIGVVAHFADVDGLEYSTYGLGYSYVASQFTFTVDASKVEHKDEAFEIKRYHITPGIMLRAGNFQLSVNDLITFNSNSDGDGDGDETNHDLWFGVGFAGSSSWHLAVYSDYQNDVAAVASFYF